MSAQLAGWNLYVSRGMVDQEDTRFNQLKMHHDAAEQMLDDILAARITIAAELATEVTYPTVENTDAA